MPTAVEIRQTARLFVFPVLYFASVVPVVIGLIEVFMLEEYYVEFSRHDSLYFSGDISAVASLLVIGSPVFGMFSWLLVRLEGLSRPTPADHLRRCAFLYAFVGISGAVFAADYVGNLVADNPMYELPKAVVIWAVAGYAILVDALVLLRERRRNRADHRGDP